MGTPPFFTIPPGCAIAFMGAAILEQQEQQEKVDYKESFPTTIYIYIYIYIYMYDYKIRANNSIRAFNRLLKFANL